MRKRPRLAFVERPSPNFNERKGHEISFLVLHYTAMDTAEAAIQRLCDPASQVSAHYVVAEDGTVYRLVAEDKRAWHAGISYWDTHTDLNSRSVGIEIANNGSSPYPEAQMQAVIDLSQEIANRYGIRAFYVVGHSDIAPDRKQDPGHFFDWKRLSTRNLGVWPVPTMDDYRRSQLWGDLEVIQGMNKLGYRSNITLPTLVTAFQRHYQPEAFGVGGSPGIADAVTKARLYCLLRRKAIGDGVRASQARRKNKKKNDKSKSGRKSKR
ncbi:MAG: N-acetylmuramoyl-L-alanine amidase [Cyanobacteria bacterium SZAS LIN-2]|nr:N-acetylmuramoyl-L-alanine amidase [Cyanobacteria bacterium SZAS LIN-2]